jgi:glutamyl-tRNA reductase
MEERSRQASEAEALIAAEVERFHQRQRTVNAAPAIVALQRKAEEIRVAEMQRIHSRLGPLTQEQLAAVEALTRGLVNKFLHPPMQALKQAAREGDSARLDALCEEWSVSPVGPGEMGRESAAAKAEAGVGGDRAAETGGSKSVESVKVNDGGVEARR